MLRHEGAALGLRALGKQVQYPDEITRQQKEPCSDNKGKKLATKVTRSSKRVLI